MGSEGQNLFTVTPGSHDFVADLFIYHPPDEEQMKKYEQIRSAAKELYNIITNCCPSGPDRSAALRKVREAMMTANASIATNNAAAKIKV